MPLIEAAKIDGANEFQVFTKICIPICKGVITTCAILVFMDAIHYHVRSEGRIVKRAVYIALGLDMNGKKDVLGMYVGCLLYTSPDGSERPLGIPTVKDRIVQMAAKIAIEPVFEACLLYTSCV